MIGPKLQALIQQSTSSLSRTKQPSGDDGNCNAGEHEGETSTAVAFDDVADRTKAKGPEMRLRSSKASLFNSKQNPNPVIVETNFGLQVNGTIHIRRIIVNQPHKVAHDDRFMEAMTLLWRLRRKQNWHGQ